MGNVITRGESDKAGIAAVPRTWCLGLIGLCVTLLVYLLTPRVQPSVHGIALPLFKAAEGVSPSQVAVLQRFTAQRGFETRALVKLQYHHQWTSGAYKEMIDKAQRLAAQFGANAFVIDRLYPGATSRDALSLLDRIRLEGRAIYIDPASFSR